VCMLMSGAIGGVLIDRQTSVEFRRRRPNWLHHTPSASKPRVAARGTHSVSMVSSSWMRLARMKLLAVASSLNASELPWRVALGCVSWVG